jgi:uncharacterized Rmd1/YagE family protein
MNDFTLILSKTIIFVISFMLVSQIVFNILKKKNSSANRRDIEVIVISVIIASIITSIFKHILKYFI